MLFDHIRKIATLPSPTDNESAVRNYLLSELSRLGLNARVDQVGNLWVERGRLYFCAHMDKFGAPGEWVENDIKIQGRLDDSVGVGIVTTLLSAQPDMSALFTVGEEWSEARQSFGFGASKAVDFLKAQGPAAVVVIDMSSLLQPDKGAILYTSSDQAVFRPALIDRVMRIAQSESIPLQTAAGRGNDSFIFALNDLPTFALEVHVDNLHSGKEVASKKDIDLLFRLCEKICERFLLEDRAEV